MWLIIGGAGQGKLNWYLSQNPSEQTIADGETISLDTIPQGTVLNHLHRWIFRLMQENKNPQELLADYLQTYPDAVIVCDEIGCGVVPMTSHEREWREMTGRICCELAKQAVRVDRVFCGIAMTLKKEA